MNGQVLRSRIAALRGQVRRLLVFHGCCWVVAGVLPLLILACLADLPKPSKVPLDTDPPIPLWNTWPVLGLFLALITLEWVLRKRKQMV